MKHFQVVAHPTQRGRRLRLALAEERRGHATYVWAAAEGQLWRIGEDPVAQKVESSGAEGRETPASPASQTVLLAPMAARVVEVRVAEGDEVQAGAEVVVLEAMKCEQRLTAPGAVRVRRVLCARGEQVDDQQALIEYVNCSEQVP